MSHDILITFLCAIKDIMKNDLFKITKINGSTLFSEKNNRKRMYTGLFR